VELTLSAQNPLVSFSQQTPPGMPTSTATAFGPSFDPSATTVTVMAHLFAW